MSRAPALPCLLSSRQVAGQGVIRTASRARLRPLPPTTPLTPPAPLAQINGLNKRRRIFDYVATLPVFNLRYFPNPAVDWIIKYSSRGFSLFSCPAPG